MRKRSGWNTWTRRFGFGFVLLVLLIVAWTWRCVIHLNWARPELLERYPSGSKAIIIVFHILLLPLLASYLRCVFTETGSRAQQLRLHEVGPDGLPRICQICQVIKPDRSHHCSVCGQCVLKMDHHCPWLNNCVGHANQKLCVEVKVARMVGVIGREKLCAAGAYTYLMCSAMRGLFNILWSKEYFVLFLFWTFLELTFTVLVQGPEVLTCFEMTQTECSQELLFNEMLVLSFALSVGGFLAFHFYLALINRTTLELFEKPSPTAANPHTRFPYDLGWRRNLTQVFGPRPALWLIPTRSGCIADGLDWESTSPPPTPELSPA